MRAAAARACSASPSPRRGAAPGRDYVSYVLAIEAVARASATVAASLVVTNSLVAELIAHAGRDAQKERWLRATGSGRGDRGVRAVGARRRHRRGQPADDGRASGDRLPDHRPEGLGGQRGSGARGDRLRGDHDPQHPGCQSAGSRARVTAFLVPMDTPGITRTARAESLGVRGLGCMDLEFDIAVGDDQVLGPVDQGFRLAMWALQGGRVAIAAQALGIGEAALGEAIAYAKTREQFGQPIANYQAIQWMLADTATELGGRADADLEGRGREGSAGAQHVRGVDGEAGGVGSGAPGGRPARCRFSRRPATAADRSSSGCSATSARRRSIRARLRRSA